MKNKIIISIFFTYILSCLVGFYYIGGHINYPKHKEIKLNLVNHPEFIPSYEIVKGGSAGFQNIISDFYWLSAIQYIGSNAIGSEYKKYLFVILNLVTDLNPNFTYPYEIGELLLSNYNERYESGIKNEQDKYNKQALELGLKGIRLSCDSKKVEAIKKENNLPKVYDKNSSFHNPCINSNIPYFLAYIYYWNFHDGKNASEYYKITSANDDGAVGSRIMAAIMQGKGGNREKAILMFLSLAESLSTKETKYCGQFSSNLRNELTNIYGKKLSIESTDLKNIEKFREILEKSTGGKKEERITEEDDCTKYLNKAVRELNLDYLERKDYKYFTDKKKHAYSAKVLEEEKYIDYLPIDYQFDKDFPLNYFYNNDTGHWDTKTEEY